MFFLNLVKPVFFYSVLSNIQPIIPKRSQEIVIICDRAFWQDPRWRRGWRWTCRVFCFSARKWRRPRNVTTTGGTNRSAGRRWWTGLDVASAAMSLTFNVLNSVSADCMGLSKLHRILLTCLGWCF